VPAKSEKQRRFMNAVAHNPKFAAKVGVSQQVGEEFSTGVKTEPLGEPKKKRHDPLKHGYDIIEE
jgi:hypothetical protein